MPKMPRGKFRADYGRAKGRRDMERLGLFSEDPYLPGKPYLPVQEISDRGKGLQMITNSPKTKTGLQDCYFEKSLFKSLAEKDPYFSVYQIDMKYAASQLKKNRTAQFWPPGGTKLSETPGDYYGTFGGRVEEFSPLLRPKGAYKKELPNVKTNPAKKGSYGYPDITINKVPEYMPQGPAARTKFGGSKDELSRGPFYGNPHRNDFLDENILKPVGPFGSIYVKRRMLGEYGMKPGGQHWYPPKAPKWPANNHDGCFNEFPKHIPEPYGDTKRASNKSTGVFYPAIHGCDTKMYTESIVNLNADFRINQKNWRFAKPFTFKDDALPQPTQ